MFNVPQDAVHPLGCQAILLLYAKFAVSQHTQILFSPVLPSSSGISSQKSLLVTLFSNQPDSEKLLHFSIC